VAGDKQCQSTNRKSKGVAGDRQVAGRKEWHLVGRRRGKEKQRIGRSKWREE